MAEQTAVEKPTMEAPVVEAKAPEIDTKALLDELGKINVKTPEDLANIANASRQAGKAWNEVGTLRQQNEQLLQAMREMQAQMRQPVNQQSTNYAETPSEGVDLRKVVGEVVGNVIDVKLNDMNRRQLEAQRAVQREYQKIVSDDDYDMVKPVWEQHVANLNTQERLQMGETTLKSEYDNVVKTYLKEMAKRSRTAIETITKSSQKAPHMESGETQSRPLPSGDMEHQKRVRQIAEDRQKGSLDSNKALENLVKEFFPADMFKI